MQSDAKRVQNWSQKCCKNSSKINAKTGTEQIMKFMNFYVYLDVFGYIFEAG
jgi:hypothetical protein